MEEKKSKISIIISIISIIISFIIVVFAKSVSVESGFSLETFGTILSDASFWLLSITIAAALTFGYANFYNIEKQKNFTKTSFIDKMKAYNDRLKLKPANFSEYIRENNFNEKKRVWIEKIDNKISKLEEKYDKIPNEKLNKKRAVFIQKKIQKLKNKISEEFIKNKLIHTKVKYDELHAKNFRKNQYGRIINERKDASNEQVIAGTSFAVKFISSLVIIGLINALAIQCYLMLSFSASFWIIILSTIYLLIQNAFFGISFAKKVFKNEIEISIENKTLILEDAIRWASGKPEKTFREIIQEFVDEKNKELIKPPEKEKEIIEIKEEKIIGK